MTIAAPLVAPASVRVAPIPGVYFQVYRDKLPGQGTQGKTDSLSKFYDRVVRMGLPGVVVHGFPRDLENNWARLSALSNSRNLLTLAAWGLDGSKDNDGTLLTSSEKGVCIGNIVKQTNCAAGLLDAEGRWDAVGGPANEPSEQAALTLGRKIREVAGNDVLVGDQLWFAIESHGDNRRTAKPIDAGGPFRGFPADEFAMYAVNWIRFRQAYCNNMSGDNRYTRVFRWMDEDWKEFNAGLVKLGFPNLVRELGVTIQTYRWRLRDLGHCLIKYWVQNQQPVIGWGEPFPEDDFLLSTMAVKFLIKEGFAKAGVDPNQAVLSYQKVFNSKAPQTAKIDEDGWMGRKTIASMGVTVPA